MSNIVLKGDVVQNLGEYLPNVYIESVRVSDRSTTQISLSIDYSILFLIDDEYDINDITQNLKEVNVMFAFANSDKVFKKQQVVNNITSRPYLDASTSVDGDVEASDSISFDIEEISKDSIFDSIQDGNYIDDLYDEEGRRVLKITAGHTKFLSKETYKSNNLYCYTFVSVLPLPSLKSSEANVVYLNTSNIAYEKIFSPGLNVLRDEELIYLDSQGAKYGQVPLLGLNRQYYKTTTVTREDIISKVNTLVRRFDRLSVGPLSDSVTAIKYVLSTQADTENLLVELDKVRRSFPNKTNNNPVGNLYAAYTRLLQNINSAFLPSEIVTKERYLTGKVFDLRTGLTRNYTPPPTPSEQRYFSEDLFFIHRERISSDEAADAATNKATFFVRYEEWLKKQSNIFTLIDQEKFYEIAADQDLNNLRRILFSYFRIKNLFILKSHKGTGLEYLIANWGDKRDNRKIGNLEISRVTSDNAATFAILPDGSTAGVTFREYNFGFQNPLERLLCFKYSDIDTFSAIYEANEIEQNGAMLFEYTLNISIYDETNEFVIKIVNKFNQLNQSLQDYISFANEICSYNNIDNRFNDFFVKSIREQFSGDVYPWETAPTFYCVMSYLLTDEFQSFEDATRYCKNIIATISPENGNLESLVSFGNRMQDLADSQISELQNNSSALSNQVRTDGFTKEFQLIPFNYIQLRAEQSAELQFLQDSSIVRRPLLDPPEFTEGGLYFDQSTEGASGISPNDLNYALNPASTFYEFLSIDIELFINSAFSSELADALRSRYPDATGINSSVTSNVVLAAIRGSSNPLYVRTFIRSYSEALDSLLAAVILYYRVERNAEFLNRGMNYPFDSEMIESTGEYPSSIQFYMEQYKSKVQNLRREMIEILIPLEDGYLYSSSLFSDPTAFGVDMVKRIRSYYRDNTHKLMRDISSLLLLLFYGDEGGNELLTEALQYSVEQGVMPKDGEYNGPDPSSIVDFEDISL